jgi:hypothetical protein
MKSNNGNKMTGHAPEIVMIRDEDDRDFVDLNDIPEAADDACNDDDFGLHNDDKKKLGFNTTYEGFSIWGRVLCLFIERKGGPGKKPSGVPSNSQALMQDWIQTQEQKDDDT